MELSKPYPHYCAVHNLYYGSPTDTIPASMCPLCGIKSALLAQPAPRTYEVALALSWVDAVEAGSPGKQDDGKGQPVDPNGFPDRVVGELAGVPFVYPDTAEAFNTFKGLLRQMAESKSPAELSIKQARYMLWCRDNPDKLVSLFGKSAPQGWQQGAAKLARELADSIDFTGERWQARETFEAILTRHQEGNK